MKNCRCFAFILVTSFVILFQTVRADRVDDLMRATLAERHIPGAALAVIHKGRVVKMKGYGLASIEFGVPVTTTTAFEIGSVSKQMTAAAIMLLVEDGKVGLDEPVSKYIAGTPESWRPVTIRHLLTHSSGVKSYSSLDGFELIKRQRVGDFLRKLSPYPLEYTPGDRNIYSNSGFTILAYVIEAVSGKPFIEFMRERIFRPLGMNSTTDRDPEYLIPNRAVGYEWRGNRYAGRDWDLTDLLGAGTIVSTIEDMTKWDAALNGRAFLTPASRAEWWKAYTFNNGERSIYGFGWRLSEIRGHKVIGHTGQTSGFNSVNNRYVDDGLSIIVLSNTGESGLSASIANRIAKFYIPTMSLNSMKAIGDDPLRSQKFRSALSSRLANSPDASLMSATLIRNISTTRAKEVNSRLAFHGRIQAIDLVGKEIIDGRERFSYRVRTQKRVHLWRTAFDPEGKISEMTLDEEE